MSSESEDMSKPGKKRRFIIEDSSEDSSDDSIIFKNNRKRKTLKVVSDIDSSDEDSDVAISVGRKNGKVKTISTSEDESGSESGDEGSLQLESDASGWQSDWQSTNESDVEEILPKKIRNMNNEEPSQSSSSSKLNNVESDDSDGQSEKCPICLLSFKKQQVATPATCDHCFCLLCLTEWSKNVNTCPVDRQPFTLINVRFQPGGKIVRRIPVEPKNPAEEQIQEDPTFCEVCQQCDREDRMLLCDECDLGYHLECLNPPMEQVPMEEWFCPSCSINRPDLSESVEMDLDELSDIMAEARCLGGTYGRTRSGLPQDTAYPLSSNVRNNPRIIPRTRQTERVRANIRADRRRQLNNTSRNFDPDQPSTSSGIESVYDSYSHSDLVASVIQRVTSAMSRNGRKIKANSRTKSTTKKTRKKRTRKSKKTQNGNGDSVLREVRIREINDDGEEEEIVTYVKVKTSSSSGKRKIKKRTKRTRKKLRRKTTKRRALSSHYGKTVKKRLAITLGMVKGRARLPKLGEQRVGSNVETVRNNNAAMINARFRAGISQVSLFGTNLGLDYSPPGSDDEMILDNPSSNLGSIVGIQRRNVSISSTRRRLALKGVVLGHHNNLSSDSTQQLHPPAIDLLDSIISSQKLWHSKSNKIILKANGTLLLPSNRDNKEENDKNTCNGNSERDPIIKPVVDSNDINNKIEPLNLTNVNSVDIVQAPMYNGSRGGSGGRGGGGGGGGGGNRGNYHGGRYSDSSYSYSGRQNYNNRGSGISPRGGYGQRGPSPIINDFPQNFDNRLSHNFNNSFRFRNNHNYRNDNRPRMPLISNMQRPQNQFRGQNDNSLFTTPPPSFASPAISAQLSAINSPLLINNDQTGNSQEIKSNITTEEPSTSSSSLPVDDKEMNEKAAVDTDEPTGSEASPPPPLEESAGNDEDCDIYSDIESSNNDRSNNEHNESIDDDDNDKKDDGSAADCTAEVLLPPPEPPSELLIDLEENLRNDKESDDEDLIIDDTHKEPEPREIEETEQPEQVKASEKNYYDNSSKYDPFQDADSDDDTQADCPNFSIYSSETMDVARENEQQLSQVIGPLEPPPLPPDMTEEDDHDLSPVSESPKTPELPPPVQLPLPVVDSIDPYVESLRKERQQLSKIPSKKISTDSRGKITFKIGNKTKIMNKLSSLYDEIDDNINVMIEQEKEIGSSSVTNQLLTSIDNPKECASFSVGKKDNENSDELFPADGDNVDKTICDHNDGDNVEPSQMFEDDDDDDEDGDDNDDKDDKHKLDDPNSSDESERGGTPPIVQMQMKSNSDNCIISESSDVINEEESILSQDFQLEKDENIERKDKNENSKTSDNDDKAAPNDDNMEVWYSDGAYTPCKDENPILDKDTIESGLEPITPPPKDHNSDDLDRCKTPIGYAGLGTEAISETDEPINFEDEALSSPISNRKDKEIEDGEIIVEDGQSKKLKGSSDSATDDDDCEVKKKKERRDKSNNMEKNKENISSDNNQVSWKKLSKSTKDRQYREKMKRRSASKDRNRDRNRNRDHDRLRDYDKDKEKGSVKKRNKSKDRPVKESTVKETAKKKEKRKELPRYDVRKIVAEKPPRPRKDEYGRDIRAIISRSRSRGRSPLRKSHSYSPPRRSWSRNLTRSWSNHRRRSPSRGSRTSSRYSRSHSRCRTRSRTQSRSRSRSRLRSLSRSRSRRKSSITNSRRRSLSRKRSRSPSLRRRRSLSSHRQRKSHQKRLPMRKRKSRSRSRKKDKSKKHKSRSRSRRRKRSWSKSPQPSVRRDKEKKRLKRKCIAGKSRSRDRSASRNWDNVNIPRSLDRGYPIRGTAVNPSVALLQTGIMDKEQINHTSSQNQSSWSGAQWTPSWSRSKSKSRSRSRSRSSAPGGLDTVGPKNLTVILTNKEAIKKKRKEKRLKEGKKRRDGDIERIKKRDKRNRTPPPSKEVFASGDNILVSVCFNNDNSDNLGQISGDKNQTTSSNCNNLTDELADTISSLTSKKRKRRTCREIGMTVSKEQQPSLKKPKKDKAKDKRSVKSPEPKLRNRREKKKKSKAAEIAASKKPVAVIDLDQSPFREQTPSPKDIIVLSDDEDNDSNQLHQQQQNQIHANLPCNLHQQQQKLTDTRQLHDDKTIQEQGNDNDNLQRDEFVGPKTPPEPQIKFSINKQSSNLRASMINPLMDEEEEEDDDDDDDDDGDNDADVDDDDDADDDTNVDNGNNQKNSNDDNIDKGKIDKNDLQNNLLNSNDLSRENELKGNNDNNIIIVGDNNDDELDDLEALELLEMNERTHGSLLQKNDTDNQCELDKHERTEERRNLDELELRLKIGPNTPPDPPTSPPTSPDAYDPFDPTKSRSPTPTASQETSIGIDSGLTSNDSMKLSVIQNKDNFNNDKRDNNDKPKIISMVTIKRAGSPSTTSGNNEKIDDTNKLNSNLSTGNQFTTINPVLATVAAAVQRIGIQRNLTNSQIKQRTSERSNQLPNLISNSVKNITGNFRGSKMNANLNKQNGNELTDNATDTTAAGIGATTIDTSSPYSPGSSLSDGIFDPPPHHQSHNSPPTNIPSNLSSNKNKTNKSGNSGKDTSKKDAFDVLFGSSPLVKPNKSRNKKTIDKRKRNANSKIGVRMDENELQILDDLPSSAVEMQVKDKFLKKLNRQERVVEEVKLVLKPHYTKKHVTKEEYKDIMRKAVPKICHNKSGEINPKKIAQLVEAYVRKCRNNKKKGSNANTSSNAITKNLRPMKTLWS